MALVMFVGGPIDGETREVEGQPEFIEIPYRAAGSTEFPDLPRFNAATYRFARKHAAGRNSTGFYQYQRG